jgi:diacylglycerol kinase family enzyme
MPDDGVLNFLVIKGVSRLTFIKVVGEYAKGLYRKYPQYITHLQGDSIEIKSETDMVVNIDGEAITGKNVTFKVIPRGVNFIFPTGMGYFKNRQEKTEEK